jgi:membrane-associated phospholipid phosphatase
MRRLLIAPLLVAAGVAAAQSPAGPGCPCPPPPACDAVLRFNEAALAAIRTDRTPPPVAVRRLALVHVAVYDAVNATAPDHEPFRVAFDAPVDADPEAAAAVAAHRTLTEFYPGQAEQLDAVLAGALAPVPAGPRKSRGIALGQLVAERVLAWRAGDAAVARGSRYAPRPAPGRWRPTPPEFRPPLLPGWGGVACLALPDSAAFRPPGPPDLTSREYAEAYRQVRDLGGGESRVRTRDQTEVAFFWADGDGTITPPGHWNRIAQEVARGRGTTLAENARLFALLNVAMADAGVVCWECKYRFDVWRPVTAIREEDPDWSPLLPTPPFPAYTSGHSSFSGAAAAALAAFFGSDDVRFGSTSDGLPGVVRVYAGFWAAAEEAGMSRIYGGIHWAFDNADGLRCGREVGEYVAGHSFRSRESGGRGVSVEFAIRRRDR